MLSLSNGGMTAAHAGQYFSQEDYYLKGEEPSQWLGKSAATFRLQGRVKEAAFRNLASGKSPDGMRQLVTPKITKGEDGAQVANHRAGNDLTFSAPKSVSIGYAAGNRELKEIWDQAVVNTMKYVEEHYSHYRTPDGLENAGNIIAAKFDHVTSRALDPEVHSHVFLLNMVQTPDGWKANEPKNIYQDKIALGMLAREEAINLYRKAGYSVYFTDREKLLFEIEGVRQDEIEAFSQRSAAIAEKVSQWKEERKFPGIADTILKQMAALDTRDPKRQVTHEDVRRAWEKGFETAGTTPVKVKESIEAASKSLPPVEEIAPPGHVETKPASVVKTASDLITENEVVFDRALLLKTAVPISGGRHSIAELNDAIVTSRALRLLGREKLGWDSGREFLTTRKMLQLESRNVTRLKGLRSFHSITSTAEVSAYLKGLAGEAEKDMSPEERSHLPAFKTAAASASREAPLLLTPGQRQHIVNDLVGSKGFAVTQGDPGTGKTFAAAIIDRFNSDVLETSGRRHITVNLAYTGKAALEIEKAGGTPSFTIDSFLARAGEARTPAALLGVERTPLQTQIVIKIDEASLVGGRQAGRILSVIGELRKEGLEVKLSLVGDSKQMQSIQASPFFRHASDLAREEHGEYAVMKEITRQKDAGLLAVAKCLNRSERHSRPLGTNATDALKMLQQQGRVFEIPERPELVKAAVDRYLSESAKPTPSGTKQSVLAVATFNSDRHELNREIRQARLQRGELANGATVEVLVPVEHGVTASSYHPGMTVIFAGSRTKNPERMKVNLQGEVLSANSLTDKVHVGFPDGKSKIFEACDLAQQSSLYLREQREFSQGDVIVFGKNTRNRSIVTAYGAGKNVGVRNGERGEITEIRVTDKETVATIAMLSDGRKVDLQLTRFGPQHIDHGYAVTVHKGQGETVDSVISFNYVKPLSSNDKNRLQSLTRLQISDAEFSRWNSTLSDLEKSYQTQTRIGGHAGQIFFVMIADPQNAQEQKGIAITFSNGRAVVEDDGVRSQMREAGMYWSPTAGAWVTAATNDSAIHLIPRHPLKDPQYLDHLKTFEKSRSAPHPGERNYTAEIDTTGDMVKYGHASYNSFNVAMTRARHEAALFTNSLPGLKKSVQLVDQKSTTVSRPSIGRNPAPSRSQPTPTLSETKELKKELKLPKR